MEFRKNIFVIIILCVFFSSCIGKNSNNNNSNNIENVIIKSIRFDGVYYYKFPNGFYDCFRFYVDGTVFYNPYFFDERFKSNEYWNNNENYSIKRYEYNIIGNIFLINFIEENIPVIGADYLVSSELHIEGNVFDDKMLIIKNRLSTFENDNVYINNEYENINFSFFEIEK